MSRDSTDDRTEEKKEEGKGKGKGRRKERAPRPERFSFAWFADWFVTILVAVVIFIVLRVFVIATFVITSGSMEDTLLVGDFLLVNRVAFGSPVPLTSLRVPGYAEPRHGEIIVFRADHSPGLDIVKRTLGLPGDTLWMDDGRLHRNGVQIDEPYAYRNRRSPDTADPDFAWQAAHLVPDSSRAEYSPTRNNWGPLIVPAERYFMLGDNRDGSLDSRFWGFVEREKIRGRPFFIYFSYDRQALKPVPILTAMRLGRLGPLPD